MSKWFQDKVVYQIYPMSFKDSKGSGLGDLKGITSKLDYLEFLGVDVIWLSPIYMSPKDDNGYDISDYYNIDPLFGTMEDFDEMLGEAKLRKIGIIMDVVANHTSTEHEWFKRALNGEKKYQDFYVFRDKAFVEAHPITSIFGGNAWEYVSELDLYYLHNFAVSQADLDWDNKEVRFEIYKMMNFWLEKGVKGFRFDVIDMISKVWEKNQMSNGPKLHEYIEEMQKETYGKYSDTITVGETWSASLDHMEKYSNLAGSEFSMVFNFEHTFYNHDKWSTLINKDELKKIYEKNQRGMFGRGWNSLFLNNHDLPRLISRFGDEREEYREITGKQWALLLHMMQGTPYIFQGEEIGMINRNWEKSEIRDIEALNFYNERIEKESEEKVKEMLKNISRDNARTPMQWDSSENAGFTTGTPWIVTNESYKNINVAESLDRFDSLFYFYKRLIELRKGIDVITSGDFTLILPEEKDYFIYKRESMNEILLVVSNLSDKEQKLPDLDLSGMLLMHNYEDEIGETLRPYETFAILVDKE